MRIFYTAGSDPMILDSVAALNALHAELEAFLASEQRALCLQADQSGSAEPYDELLAGLEVEKSEGAIYASLTDGRRLRVEGGLDNLRMYVNFFSFRDDEDGSHHHPEHVSRTGYIRPGTMSVIIEADNTHVENLRRES